MEGDVGRVLAHLRNLGGLSRDDCAVRAGLTADEVDAAERGVAVEPMRRLADFYGVDPEELFGYAMSDPHGCRRLVRS